MQTKYGDRPEGSEHWKYFLRQALTLLLEKDEFKQVVSVEHRAETPDRVVKAFGEYFWGVYEDPASVLTTAFEERVYDELIIVAHIQFHSFCSHHLSPFVGAYTFAYLPDKKIVGLSKIPRFVEILAARPQVQEMLSKQIVSIFQDVVKPKGCGVVMDALHTCMCIRGIEKFATTRTIALSELFKMNANLKSELLASVGSIPKQLF